MVVASAAMMILIISVTLSAEVVSCAAFHIKYLLTDYNQPVYLPTYLPTYLCSLFNYHDRRL